MGHGLSSVAGLEISGGLAGGPIFRSVFRSFNLLPAALLPAGSGGSEAFPGHSVSGAALQPVGNAPAFLLQLSSGGPFHETRRGSRDGFAPTPFSFGCVDEPCLSAGSSAGRLGGRLRVPAGEEQLPQEQVLGAGLWLVLCCRKSHQVDLRAVFASAPCSHSDLFASQKDVADSSGIGHSCGRPFCRPLVPSQSGFADRAFPDHGPGGSRGRGSRLGRYSGLDLLSSLAGQLLSLFPSDRGWSVGSHPDGKAGTTDPAAISPVSLVVARGGGCFS